jgi:hypothetical protein
MTSGTISLEELNRLKQKTARLSVVSNTVLVILKFLVGFTIGSVSIISEAIHSMMIWLPQSSSFFLCGNHRNPRMSITNSGMGNLKIFPV